MKDISIYFKPVSEEFSESLGELHSSLLINDTAGFPEIDKKGIALIYVPEYRNSTIEVGTNEEFRKQFYQLSKGDNWDFSIYDLGTIVPGEKTEDTYFALSQVVSELLKKEILPFVIGGGQDLTLSLYRGFEAQEQTINICSIDSSLDIGDPNAAISANGFISHLLMQRPCYLFNYTTIGVQRPYTAKKDLDLFDKLYFDVCRLGEVNDDFKVAEPFLRNSDMRSIDFSSIHSHNDNKYNNTNGLNPLQICQMAKYAGISDKMSCVGVFDILPNHNVASSNLLAQIIWYFIDGYSMRIGDFPIGSKKNYKKFYVHLDDFEDDLIFYKSDKSNRWWLEVQYSAESGSKYDRHKLVPCNKEDYENALKDNIPDLWWKTLKKIQ